MPNPVQALVTITATLLLLVGCRESTDPIGVLHRTSERLLAIMDEGEDCEKTVAKLEAFKEELAVEMQRARNRAREMRRSMTLEQRRAYNRKFARAYASFSRRLRNAMKQLAQKCNLALELGTPAKPPL